MRLSAQHDETENEKRRVGGRLTESATEGSKRSERADRPGGEIELSAFVGKAEVLLEGIALVFIVDLGGRVGGWVGGWVGGRRGLSCFAYLVHVPVLSSEENAAFGGAYNLANDHAIRGHTEEVGGWLSLVGGRHG